MTVISSIAGIISRKKSLDWTDMEKESTFLSVNPVSHILRGEAVWGKVFIKYI